MLRQRENRERGNGGGGGRARDDGRRKEPAKSGSNNNFRQSTSGSPPPPAAIASSAASAGDSEHSLFVQECWLRWTCDAFYGCLLVLLEQLDIAREAALAAQALNRVSIEP